MPTIPSHSYAPKSCDLWNHRTAHRGCGPQANKTNPTHDPACSTLHLPHSARIKVTGNHNRNPIVTCKHTIYFEARNACLLMDSSRTKHMNALSVLFAYILPAHNLSFAGNHNLNLTVLCMPTTCFNMLRGEKLLTPDELHSHTCNNLQLDATCLHLVSLDPTDLCAARGDFSCHCLNHYCLTTQNTAFIGKRIVFFTPVEAIFDALSKHGEPRPAADRQQQRSQWTLYRNQAPCKW
jgi:hypothetical protein